MSDLPLTVPEIDFLLSPRAIRERAQDVFQLTREGGGHFQFNPDKFKPAVDYVLATIQKNYPQGNIPFHSRWGHFRAGGVDRASKLDERLKNADPFEKARARLDLVITSVLLDAGAGAAWSYSDKATGKSFGRSEGLGIASLDMFLAGAMSSDGKSPRADFQGLSGVGPQDLRLHFQVSEKNPLLGVEGRVGLLNGLANAVRNAEMFKDGRPGNIIDYLHGKHGQEIPAPAILRAVLDGFGSIWPGRLSARGRNLGDVWKHSKVGLVPFHKLSQWMTYSLIEPIQDAGLKVTGVEQLTGLAEYRNGGLMIDSGLLTLKNPADAAKKWKPDSELIIEWRALTVHFLDRMGTEVQSKLNKSAKDFPLAKVLEGGTWWAGRFMAQEKRPGGEPPLQIESDGTVF